MSIFFISGHDNGYVVQPNDRTSKIAITPDEVIEAVREWLYRHEATERGREAAEIEAAMRKG